MSVLLLNGTYAKNNECRRVRRGRYHSCFQLNDIKHISVQVGYTAERTWVLLSFRWYCRVKCNGGDNDLRQENAAVEYDAETNQSTDHLQIAGEGVIAMVALNPRLQSVRLQSPSKSPLRALRTLSEQLSHEPT